MSYYRNICLSFFVLSLLAGNAHTKRLTRGAHAFEANRWRVPDYFNSNWSFVGVASLSKGDCTREDRVFVSFEESFSDTLRSDLWKMSTCAFAEKPETLIGKRRIVVLQRRGEGADIEYGVYITFAVDGGSYEMLRAYGEMQDSTHRDRQQPAGEEFKKAVLSAMADGDVDAQRLAAWVLISNDQVFIKGLTWHPTARGRILDSLDDNDMAALARCVNKTELRIEVRELLFEKLAETWRLPGAAAIAVAIVEGFVREKRLVSKDDPNNLFHSDPISRTYLSIVQLADAQPNEQRKVFLETLLMHEDEVIRSAAKSIPLTVR